MAPPDTPNSTITPAINPPSLEPLNTMCEDMLGEWEYWKRSFERFCRLAKLTSEADRIDVFYAYIGRDTETYIRDLPNFTDLDSIAKLIEVVQSRYTKSPNILCERYRFRNVTINPNESIGDFNLRLNSYSKSCDFNNYSRDLAHLES